MKDSLKILFNIKDFNSNRSKFILYLKNIKKYLIEFKLGYLNSSNKINNEIKELLKNQIYSKWSIYDSLISLNSYDLKSHKSYKCPICQKDFIDENFEKYESYCIFGGGRLIRIKCPFCNVIFGDKKMLSLNDEELSSEYNWHYKAYDEGDSTESELRTFYLLEPIKSGVYLNYGAGNWSKTNKLLREKGWTVYSFEPHLENFKSNKYEISNIAELKNIKFDGVFSNNVLEHLRYPIRDLILMHSILSDNGRMAHTTPCYEYLFEYTRFHLFFFVGKSQEYIAEKSGFMIEKKIRDGIFMCNIFKKY